VNRPSPARFFCFGIGLHICLYGTNVRRRALVILRLVVAYQYSVSGAARIERQNTEYIMRKWEIGMRIERQNENAEVGTRSAD
jgi:hypothetical protein